MSRHLRGLARRFAGDVMSVSGVLLIGSGASTVLWQEPVSALIAARDQPALE